MKTKRFKVEIDFFDEDEDEIHENLIGDWIKSSYEFDNIHVEVRVEELKGKS